MRLERPVVPWMVLSLLLTALPLSAAAAPASRATRSSAATISQEQYNKIIELLRKLIVRSNAMKREIAQLQAKQQDQGTPSSGEQAVDLNALDATGAAAAPSKSGVAPNLKVYFDLNLVYLPKTGNPIGDITFENFHHFLFFEITPTPTLTFSFDVEPSPLFYELDWQATPKLQFRVGKITIPFDDLSPHSIFGGRTNVSDIMPASNLEQFLPDVWADLGVGIKYQLVDASALSLAAQLYAVQGFASLGETGVPVANGGTDYPNFRVTPDKDNNNDKSLGGRVHALFFNQLGIGASYFHGRWTPNNEERKTLSIYGLDGQYRFNPFEFRAGLALMKVDVPGATDAHFASFNRTGAYVEGAIHFGEAQKWKFLVRGGRLQLDDRVIEDVTDMTIVGATLCYKPSNIEFQLHLDRDLDHVDAKTNYTYGAARVIIAL